MFTSVIKSVAYNTYRMSPIQNVLIYNKQTAYEAHLRKGTDLKNGHYNLDKLQSAHNMHKRYLKKVNMDKNTQTRTFQLKEKIGPEGRCFQNSLKANYQSSRLEKSNGTILKQWLKCH